MVATFSDDVPRILTRDERPTPRGAMGESDTATAIVSAIAASARAAVASARLGIADIAAAGCSAPGPLDHVTGVIHETPNLAGFHETPLASLLSAALGGIRVFLDRDTCMAAIAEGLAGAARGARDHVYVTVSTGVGGAVVSGGRLLRGATNTAGELGHWPVAFAVDPARAADDGLPRCGCGSFGCVESFAAGANMARQYGAAEAEEVYAAATRGDARAAAIVARAERALAALAVGVVNALNPSILVVGGAIAEHQPAHVLEPMRRAVRDRAFAAPSGAVRVVPAALGADVGMLGAVLEARERAAGRGDWFL